MIDLDKLTEVMDEIIDSGGKESHLYVDEALELINRIRQAEKDAARYRFIKQWNQSHSLNVYRKDLWDDVVDKAMWMESQCNK